jgi:hypothetical protein
MAISYVGGATAAATTVTLPSHQAGDLIFGWAWHSPTNTGTPAVPAGWYMIRNIIRSSGVSARVGVLGYKIAQSNSETSGTWQSAILLGCVVYRDTAAYIAVGGWNVAADNTTTSFNYAALSANASLQSNNTILGANTWVVGFGGINSNALSIETPPSGMTNRVNIAGASVGEVAIHDTNGNVASWPQTATMLSSADYGSSLTVEIYRTGHLKTTGGGLFIGGGLTGGMRG